VTEFHILNFLTHSSWDMHGSDINMKLSRLLPATSVCYQHYQ